MRYHLSLIAILFPLIVIAQQKGTSPIRTSSIENRTSNTYAVVVGISDYQDPGIPDLRFADKDAEAFANFLRSPAGGSLDEDHLKLLTDDQATTAQFDAALSWLLDESKEGDQTIIYFSGHGDVELRTRSQQGFLLCWDSPSKGYVAGAYPVFFIKEIIATLSLENKAKVLVITDACRSGKLAGNAIGGAQLTSQNLAAQYANETKILSCQPNEFSIEGEQWGGGRGAFSYHLIDGLIGMADNNGDQAVNLMEISRYLEDHVTTEVAPQSQVPMTVGNRTETITQVFPELLAEAKKGRKGQMALFAATESRGMEEDILASVDTIVRQQYRLFKQSLGSNTFLEPNGACADAYYSQLIKVDGLKRLHAAMTRNYAAALQDDAQQVLNKILNNDVEENSLSKVNQTEKYRLYPQYLERASALLGADHYMYSILQARKLYFEGYLMHIDNKNDNKALGEKVLSKYRSALALQPDFPHPYYSISAVHFWQMRQLDSAEYYAAKAVAQAPTWFMPFTNLARMYINLGRDYSKRTGYYLDLAEKTDSVAAMNNVWHMYQKVGYYFYKNKLEEAEQISHKILARDSTFYIAHRGLGIIYTRTKQFEKAETSLMKILEKDSTDFKAAGNLGNLYLAQKKYATAERYYLKALKLDSSNAEILMVLGELKSKRGQKKEAEGFYLKALKLSDRSTCVPCTYALILKFYLKTGRANKAEQLVLQAINSDSLNAGFHRLLVNVYSHTNQFEKGNKALKKMLEVDPANLESRKTAGMFFARIGDYQASEKEFDFVLKRDTNFSSLHLNRGYLYAKMGRYKDAIAALEKQTATYSGPGFPPFIASIYFNYAVLYSLQNQPNKAFEFLEKALQQNYDQWNYILFKNEPAFDVLRAQKERWEEMMERFTIYGER